jgi:MerR family copper efflux transcriptional regulator
MFISEFSKLAGLSPDTVRFYIKTGVLRPERSAKGGRHAYQVFSDQDLEAVEIIRICQALGLSLSEIAGKLADLRSQRTSIDEIVAFMDAQKVQIDRKIADLQVLRRFVEEKAIWLQTDRLDADKPRLPRLGGS